MSKSDGNKSDAQNPGVYIIEGMQLTIPSFSIEIAPDGEISVEMPSIRVGLDMCPYWLEIAFDHLQRTEQANQKVHAAHEAGDDERLGEALKAEFTSGMQAIMASAIALDAYYAAVKERADIANIDELSRTWRENGTARYKQVAELLKRAFPMPQEAFESLRNILKQNFEYRDRAVHPPAESRKPVIHPDLNKAMEWRLVTFRFYNAKGIVNTTFQIITKTADNEHQGRSEKLKEYCNSLTERLESLVQKWENQYGS